MHEDITTGGEATAAGISRRDLLRKGAVVGGAGALMWAAPSITKFGGAAFGQEGTPLTDFSAFGALIECTHTDGHSTLFRVKANQSGQLPNITWESPAGKNIGNCQKVGSLGSFFDAFQDSSTVGISGAGWISFAPSGGGYTMTITGTPAGYEQCTFKMAGGVEGVLKQSNCCLPGQKISDTTILFPSLASPTTQAVCESAGGYWV